MLLRAMKCGEGKESVRGELNIKLFERSKLHDIDIFYSISLTSFMKAITSPMTEAVVLSGNNRLNKRLIENNFNH